MTKTIRIPGGLGTKGSALWRKISGEFEMSEAELALLEQAARVADVIAQLDKAMVGADILVKGSQGQQRENPILSEARQQRALFARLVGQLKVPGVETTELLREDELGRKRRDAVGKRYGR